MRNNYLLGLTFDVNHAAGTTRYRVDAEHPQTAGHFQCTVVEGLSGSHHFIGSLQTFSRINIEACLRDSLTADDLDGGARYEFVHTQGLDF